MVRGCRWLIVDGGRRDRRAFVDQHVGDLLDVHRADPEPFHHALRRRIEVSVLLGVVFDGRLSPSAAEPIEALIRKEKNALGVMDREKERRRSRADSFQLREGVHGGGCIGALPVCRHRLGYRLVDKGTVVGRDQLHQGGPELAMAPVRY